jgi:RNA polymerase sigma factor (TIGR02999 family)
VSRPEDYEMSSQEAPGNASEGSQAGEVTALLHQLGSGGLDVRDRLVALMYPELCRLAQRHMRAERLDHTLQTTALVHEFFLEMARQERQIWTNRAHFLAAASQAMRRLLVDHARTRKAAKRGGGAVPADRDPDTLATVADFPAVLELDELLDRLASQEPRMAKVVEMRCFGGLSQKEIGDVLGIDERTAKRDWQVAKAWLQGQLRRSLPHAR